MNIPLLVLFSAVSLLPIPSTENHVNIQLPHGEEIQTVSAVGDRAPQYETYYNGRFDFAIAYPSNFVSPQPPPTNADGREFVSPEGDIKMVANGSNRPRGKTIEESYRESMEWLRESGAEVTYDDLGEDEFVISGYDNSGQVFYTKTLLMNGYFIDLNLTYDRDLQPEFDRVVADISNSLRGIDDERQISVFFPKENPDSEEGLGAVEPVIRTTDRVDVAEFAVEQLLEGPTEAESYFVDPVPVEIAGESVCGGQDFTVDIEGETAIVQFCRRVIRGGVGDVAKLENSIKKTVRQFSSVDEVVLLNRDGNCLIDFSENNECLARLPESERQ